MALADLFEEGLGPVRDQWPPEGRGEGSHQSRVTKHGHEIAVGPFADLGAKGFVDSVKKRLRFRGLVFRRYRRVVLPRS